MDVGNHIAGTQLRIRCQFGRHHQVRDFLLAHLRDERWWRRVWQRQEIHQVLRSHNQPDRHTLALQLARALCEDRLALVHDPHSPWSALEIHSPHIWQLMQATQVALPSASQNPPATDPEAATPSLEYSLGGFIGLLDGKHPQSESPLAEDEFFAGGGVSDELWPEALSATGSRAKSRTLNKKQPKPGDHDFIGPIKHNIEAVFSGHGSFFPEHGTTVVPEGTTITFYCVHGALTSNTLGNAIEEGRDLSRVYKKTYYAGDEVPNYVLHPVEDLEIKGRPITVNKDTTLSKLLKPGMGNCHWAACLYNPDEEFSNLIFLLDGIVDEDKWVYLKKYDKPKSKTRNNVHGS